MAIPSIVAGSTSAVSTTSISLAYPTVSAGNAIYAVVMDRSNSTETPPSGWTSVKEVYLTVSTSRLFLFKKDDPATGSETGSELFSFSANNRKVGFMFATNGDTIDGDYSTGGFSGDVSSINHDAVTTTGDDRLLIYVFGASTYSAYTPNTADFTPAQTMLAEAARAQPSSAYIGVGYEGKATAGASTVRSSSFSGTPADVVLAQFTFAVYSSGGGGGTPAVTDIDTDESITDGQGTFTVTTADFGDEVDTITISDGTYDSANLFDGGTGGSYTADSTNITAQSGDSSAGQPNWFTGTLTLTADDGTDSAELGVAWAPASGWTTQAISGDAGTEGYISFGRVGGAYDNGSVAYYPTAQSTSISGEGIIATSATSDFNFFVWSAEDGTIEEVTVTISRQITPDAGSVSVSGFSVEVNTAFSLITPAAGTVTATGQEVEVVRTRTIAPAAGVVQISGTSPQLVGGRTFSSGGGGLLNSLISSVIR